MVLKYYLRRRVFVLLLHLLICSFSLIANVFAQEEDRKSGIYYLDPIVVHPELDNERYHDSLRHTEKISFDQSLMHQFSAEDINGNSSVDVQRRGVFNTQADLQIRGSSFEQTDVLIDGVRVNDPQTGHFSLDVPLFSEDIEKIIAISGPAGSVYGAARQGGSIHILTKKPDKEKIKATVIAGEKNYLHQGLSCTYKIAQMRSRTSLGQTSSDGYRYNTDFKTIGISHISTLSQDYGDLNFTFNFLDKEFGANGFYSEFYPEQKEHTKTIFTTLGFDSQMDTQNINFSPKLYYREHADRFWLDRTRPGWYENLHTNYLQGGKVDCIWDTAGGKLFAGVDSSYEKINSASLGDHNRSVNTAYSEYRIEINKFLLALGLNRFFYDDFKDQLLPEISLGYQLQKTSKIRAAFNRSVRVPTFTELYYQSPANMGNENLGIEKSKNYELGFDYNKDYFSVSLTAFQREGKDLIDWVRDPAVTVYQVVNISKVKTLGLETNMKLEPCKISPGLEHWRELMFGYTYIDKDKQASSLVSKYAFDFMKHKIFLSSNYNLIKDIMLKMDLNYVQRINSSGDFIFNVKFLKRINNYTLFFNINNLFDNIYTEKEGISLPGRWLFLGASVEF